MFFIATHELATKKIYVNMNSIQFTMNKLHRKFLRKKHIQLNIIKNITTIDDNCYKT